MHVLKDKITRVRLMPEASDLFCLEIKFIPIIAGIGEEVHYHKIVCKTNITTRENKGIPLAKTFKS